MSISGEMLGDGAIDRGTAPRWPRTRIGRKWLVNGVTALLGATVVILAFPGFAWWVAQVVGMLALAVFLSVVAVVAFFLGRDAIDQWIERGD